MLKIYFILLFIFKFASSESNYLCGNECTCDYTILCGNELIDNNYDSFSSISQLPILLQRKINLCICGDVKLTTSGVNLTHYNMYGVMGSKPSILINITEQSSYSYIFLFSSNTIIKNINFEILSLAVSSIFKFDGMNVMEFAFDNNAPLLNASEIDIINNNNVTNIVYSLQIIQNFFTFDIGNGGVDYNLVDICDNNTCIGVFINVSSNIFYANINESTSCNTLYVEENFIRKNFENNIFVDVFIPYSNTSSTLKDNFWLGNCEYTTEQQTNVVLNEQYKKLINIQNNDKKTVCIICNVNTTYEQREKCDYIYHDVEEYYSNVVDNRLVVIKYYENKSITSFLLSGGDTLLFYGTCEVCGMEITISNLTISSLDSEETFLVSKCASNFDTCSIKDSMIMKINADDKYDLFEINVSNLTFTCGEEMNCNSLLVINNSHVIKSDSTKINVQQNNFTASTTALRLLLCVLCDNNNVNIENNSFHNNNESLIINFKSYIKYDTSNLNNQLSLKHNHVVNSTYGVTIFTSDYLGYDSYSKCSQSSECSTYTDFSCNITSNYINAYKNNLQITLLKGVEIYNNIIQKSYNTINDHPNLLSSLSLDDSLIYRNHFVNFNDEETFLEITGGNVFFINNFMRNNINVILGAGTIQNMVPVYCNNYVDSHLFENYNKYLNGSKLISDKSNVSSSIMPGSLGDLAPFDYFGAFQGKNEILVYSNQVVDDEIHIIVPKNTLFRSDENIFILNVSFGSLFKRECNVSSVVESISCEDDDCIAIHLNCNETNLEVKRNKIYSGENNNAILKLTTDMENEIKYSNIVVYKTIDGIELDVTTNWSASNNDVNITLYIGLDSDQTIDIWSCKILSVMKKNSLYQIGCDIKSKISKQANAIVKCGVEKKCDLKCNALLLPKQSQDLYECINVGDENNTINNKKSQIIYSNYFINKQIDFNTNLLCYLINKFKSLCVSNVATLFDKKNLEESLKYTVDFYSDVDNMLSKHECDVVFDESLDYAKTIKCNDIDINKPNVFSFYHQKGFAVVYQLYNMSIGGNIEIVHESNVNINEILNKKNENDYNNLFVNTISIAENISLCIEILSDVKIYYYCSGEHNNTNVLVKIPTHSKTVKAQLLNKVDGNTLFISQKESVLTQQGYSNLYLKNKHVFIQKQPPQKDVTGYNNQKPFENSKIKTNNSLKPLLQLPTTKLTKPIIFKQKYHQTIFDQSGTFKYKNDKEEIKKMREKWYQKERIKYNKKK